MTPHGTKPRYLEVSLGDSGRELWRSIFLMRGVAIVAFGLVLPWLLPQPDAGLPLLLGMLGGVLPYNVLLQIRTHKAGRPPAAMAFLDMAVIAFLTWWFPALWTAWLAAMVSDLAFLTLMFGRSVGMGAMTLGVALLLVVVRVPHPTGSVDVHSAVRSPSVDIVAAAILALMLVPVLDRLWQERRGYVERLRRLSAQLIDAQEAERTRLARELHDDVGQQLTGIKLMLAVPQKEPDGGLSPRIQRAERAVEALITKISTLSYLLRPPVLDEVGLPCALRRLVTEMTDGVSLEARLDTEGLEDGLPPDIEMAIYRVAQEGLTNVLRHSGSDRVEISLRRFSDFIQLDIEDEGGGFDPRAGRTRGTGLIGMHERITALDGRLSISSRPGAGTRLEVRLPLRAPADHPPQ